MSLSLAVLSLLIELAVGYPDRLVRAIGHPVIWIGKFIAWLDRQLNHATESAATRKFSGVGAVVLLVLLALGVGHGIELALGALPFGFAITALLGSSLLAQRSLASHVAEVATAMETQGLATGRKAVAKIVGRDPDVLDEAGVCRAAIESLAENFSDGIVAPAFWLGVGGLGGRLAYKAVNTADSMIGHRTPRHESFGWASARFDDLINLPASRLTALLIVSAAWIVPGANPADAARAVARDAGKHRSPNAGWPEAAMAGALGLALNGPRAYGGVVVDDATMGAGGRRDATPADIRRALRLYWTADILLVALFALLAAAGFLVGSL